jgi:hypothetical protein
MDIITETVQAQIEEKYKSVRQFAIEAGIPYTTLKSALKHGIEGMAVETFIDICDRLDIDLRTFSKKKTPAADEGDRRGELLTEITSMLGKMDAGQLNRYLILMRYAYLPDDEFSRLTKLLELAKLPQLKS